MEIKYPFVLAFLSVSLCLIDFHSTLASRSVGSTAKNKRPFIRQSFDYKLKKKWTSERRKPEVMNRPHHRRRPPPIWRPNVDHRSRQPPTLVRQEKFEIDLDNNFQLPEVDHVQFEINNIHVDNVLRKVFI